jgi:uncharacterized membrane protein
MAFCANCGATVVAGSGFCASCGKPVGAVGQGAVAAAAAAPAPAPSATVSTGSGLTPNVAGALAYALGFITGILFLVLEPYKNDRFVRFHAMQSILYSVFCIIFSIAWGIVWGMMYAVSASLFFVAMPLRLLISLAMFLLWLFLMYQAYNQKEYQLPVIGPIAAKQVPAA